MPTGEQIGTAKPPDVRGIPRPVRLIVFAKWPQAGLAKTRLIPALGAQRAADLARKLLVHTLAQAVEAGLDQIELCMTPDDPPWRTEEDWLKGIVCVPQGDGDLGLRMARACDRALTAGFWPLLIGTDCPECSAGDLRLLAQALRTHDAVIVPAADGGYPAIGLSRPHHEVFRGHAWSTPGVYASTMAALRASGCSVFEHRMMHDIDEPEDLKYLPQDWPERLI